MQRIETTSVLDANPVGDAAILAGMEGRLAWSEEVVIPADVSSLTEAPAAPDVSPHHEVTTPATEVTSPATEVPASEGSPVWPDFWAIRKETLRTMGRSALAQGLRSMQPDLPLQSRIAPVRSASAVDLDAERAVPEIVRSMQRRAAAESPRG